MKSGAIKVSDLGAAVRTFRKASGISQKDLAAMVGMSRATLNYLESGREIEIGAGRLLEVLEVLGVALAVDQAVNSGSDAKVVDQMLKAQAGKGAKRMPRPVLVEALATGRIPVGFEDQTAVFIEQSTDAQVLAAVRTAAAENGLPPKEVWKKCRALAKASGSKRTLWRHTD